MNNIKNNNLLKHLKCKDNPYNLISRYINNRRQLCYYVFRLKTS